MDELDNMYDPDERVRTNEQIEADGEALIEAEFDRLEDFFNYYLKEAP